MTTDLEDRVRRGLASYADAMAVSYRPPHPPPPHGAVVRRPRRRSRRYAWAAVTVVAGLGVGGVAAANRATPRPVQDIFDEWGEDLALGDVVRAELVATADTEDGGRLELWVGDGEHRDCLHQVVVAPDGSYAPTHDGWQHCGLDLATAWVDDEVHLVAYPEVVRGASAEGRAPVGTAEVVLELSDGSRVVVAPGAGGWFVAAFGAGLPETTRIASVAAVAADGTTLDTEVVPPASPPVEPGD